MYVLFDRKVTLMEDSDQNVHLKNLSSHQASNEEEALNLLFLGDTNRMIAEVLNSHRLSETEIKLFQPVTEFQNYFRIISATVNVLENIHELQ